MKLNIIRGILIVLILCVFFVIFGFSNQNSQTSGGTSQKVTEAITKNIKKIQDLEQNERKIVIDKIENVIRKIAHDSIYTLLGLLLMGLMSTFKIKEMDKIAVSLIIGVLYASTDEIHQAFVPGRGAQITDVILDSMGVLTGIFITMLVLEVFRRICRKKYENMT